MWSHRAGGVQNLDAAQGNLLPSVSSPVLTSALKSSLIPFRGALGAMINPGEGLMHRSPGRAPHKLWGQRDPGAGTGERGRAKPSDLEGLGSAPG